MSFQAGYAQRSITPNITRPVYLAGFDRNRRAESVHDDLTARALALDFSGTRLVLVALDIIGLGRATCREISHRFTGASLVIASTHTHHGPDTLGLWGPNFLTSGVDRAYITFLKDSILAAVSESLDNLRPAKVKAAAVTVPGIAKNARNPEVVDNELICVQFVESVNRQPFITLANFPCHPETLWRENTAITSDYPQYLRAAVERTIGAPCLFFAGALGGMMTPDVELHSFEEAEQIGERLAMVGLQATAASSAEAITTAIYIKQDFQVPLKSLLLEQALRLKLVSGAMVSKGQAYTETSLLRIGSTWLAMVPGELLPALGLQMKARMHAAGAEVCAIIGLANDELGYILPAGEYQYPQNPFEPGDHYEETMSIGPSAGPALLAAFDAILDQVAVSQGQSQEF